MYEKEMESKALEKSTNNNTAGRFLALTPSIIRRTVRICPTVDLSFLKPFWFLLRTHSKWGWMRFSRREL